jgi:hypothetical protein
MKESILMVVIETQWLWLLLLLSDFAENLERVEDEVVFVVANSRDRASLRGEESDA